MVAPLWGTETLREAQGGKEEVGEGKTEKKKEEGRTSCRICKERSNIGSIYKCLMRMDVDISNIWSMNIDLVRYQSRGLFGQVSMLRGAKSLYENPTSRPNLKQN